MTSTDHFLANMGSPTVRHAIDPDAGVEYLVEIWDADDWRIRSRPVGADGWTRWSPPVALVEVAEVTC